MLGCGGSQAPPSGPPRLLAGGEGDCTISAFELPTNLSQGAWTDAAPAHTLAAHGAYVSALVQLPRHRVASADLSGEVVIWDLVGSPRPFSRWSGHSSGVYALCHLGEGRLVSASSDHLLRLWSALDPPDRQADLGTQADEAQLRRGTRWARTHTPARPRLPAHACPPTPAVCKFLSS